MYWNIFFVVIMPYLDKEKCKDQIDNFSNLLTKNNINKFDQNICSKQCCKHTQWPISFNTIDPEIDQEKMKDYIGSNLTCNNGPSGGGCLCVTKSDLNYLTERGQI